MNNRPILLGAGIGTVTPVAATRKITIEDLTFPLSLVQIAYVFNLTQNKFYHAPAKDKAWASLSQVGEVYTLTVGSLEADLAADDVIHIQVWPSYQIPQDLVDASSVGASADTWKDQGAEIDCRGAKTIGIWVVMAVNDSIGSILQVLPKHTFAGADEYVLELVSEYQKPLGTADIKVYYEFEVNANIPYIQIQTKATSVGATAGTVTINITRGY